MAPFLNGTRRLCTKGMCNRMQNLRRKCYPIAPLLANTYTEHSLDVRQERLVVAVGVVAHLAQEARHGLRDAVPQRLQVEELLDAPRRDDGAGAAAVLDVVGQDGAETDKSLLD